MALSFPVLYNLVPVRIGVVLKRGVYLTITSLAALENPRLTTTCTLISSGQIDTRGYRA